MAKIMTSKCSHVDFFFEYWCYIWKVLYLVLD